MIQVFSWQASQAGQADSLWRMDLHDRSACSTCYLQAIDIEEKDIADQYRLLKVDAPVEKPRVVGIKNETPDELKDWEETIGED